MGQDPDLIRQQIADTRSDMSDTVDALGYKADVKARAKENVQGKVDAVTGRVTSVKDKVIGQAHDAADHVPSAEGVKTSISGGASSTKDGARQAASVAQSNPLGLAIGAVAIGFLGGLLVPATAVENEKLGPVADDLKEQARQAGKEAYDHGAAVASDAVDAAREAVKSAGDDAASAAADAASTVRYSGKEHAGELRTSVQERADATQAPV